MTSTVTILAHSQLPNTAGHSSAPALSARELLLVDTIAERVTDLLRPEQRCDRLVDAATVADTLGVSRDFVYAHAAELGGQRIGSGPRGRLRFDLGRTLAAWTSRCVSRDSQAAQTSVAAGASTRRGRGRLGTSRELLPIRGYSGASDTGEGP